MSGSATAAVVSAIAAAISATFAGATSIAAWKTVRGRRPKLLVEMEIGNPDDGYLVPHPEGVAIGVRVINVSDMDLEVLGLWCEAAPGRRFAHALRRLPVPPRVTPAGSWFVEGAGEIPGTVKAHHTELYAFRTEELGVALRDRDHGRYRPVIQTVTGCFRRRVVRRHGHSDRRRRRGSVRFREI